MNKLKTVLNELIDNEELTNVIYELVEEDNIHLIIDYLNKITNNYWKIHIKNECNEYNEYKCDWCKENKATITKRYCDNHENWE